jgi:hypothetical protein
MVQRVDEITPVGFEELAGIVHIRSRARDLSSAT